MYFHKYNFTDPVSLIKWLPRYKVGIYAVVVNDPSFMPQPFRPVYFGYSDNITGKELIKNHAEYNSFAAEALECNSSLMVSTYHEQGMTRKEAQDIINELKKEYLGQFGS